MSFPRIARQPYGFWKITNTLRVEPACKTADHFCAHGCTNELRKGMLRPEKNWDQKKLWLLKIYKYFVGRARLRNSRSFLCI